jgi:hypothetical protein
LGWRNILLPSRALRINSFPPTTSAEKSRAPRPTRAIPDGFFEHGFTACSGIDLNHTATGSDNECKETQAVARTVGYVAPEVWSAAKLTDWEERILSHLRR